MSTYNKPYRTFEQQLTLLKLRGLEVTDDLAALEYLRRLGYYRLSGYWYPFRISSPKPQKKILSISLKIISYPKPGFKMQ